MSSSSSNMGSPSHTHELRMSTPGPMLITSFFLVFLVMNYMMRRLFSPSSGIDEDDCRVESCSQAPKRSSRKAIVEYKAQHPHQKQESGDRFVLNTVQNSSIEPRWISPWIGTPTNIPNHTWTDSRKNFAHGPALCADQLVESLDGGSSSGSTSS